MSEQPADPNNEERGVCGLSIEGGTVVPPEFAAEILKAHEEGRTLYGEPIQYRVEPPLTIEQVLEIRGIKQ